jgi:hypothetical protein
MPDFASLCRRLSAALALVLLVAAGTAGTAVAAQAEYGEIGRFGAAGIGEGQFQTQDEEYGGASFGVNPTNNDVYVVDLPNEKPFKNGEFRIQRFDPNAKGEYGKPVATVTFKPQDDELKEEEFDELTNVAVDPTRNRIYVLASEERPSEEAFDPGDSAATELWAFNIEGEGLTSLGAIAGNKLFKPLGKVQGEALLEPQGIAVDPTTGDVIVLGEEGKGERGEGIDALERITPAGALAEKRWSDPVTSEAPEGVLLEDEATSPVVTKSGEILVLVGNEIDEVDKVSGTLSAEQAPTSLYQANAEVNEEPAPVREELTNFPGTADILGAGGAASLDEEGRLYTKADITEQDPEARKGSLSGPVVPGVAEFSSTGGLEKEWADEGWTGGQSIASVGASGKCKVSVDVASQVAAGSGHRVFVFDENPESPSVVEFGPGGTGCPKGRVAAPTASTLSSGGEPIAENEPIPIANKVTLSSNLVESNALSVEWEFGDGAKTTVSADQHQKTSVEHTFVKAGKLEVTERIHTDDLAEPELLTHSKIDIAGSQPVVVAEPASPVTATTATLNATVNPSGSEVESCTFEYGTSLPSGKTAPCAPSPGSGKSAVAVSAAIAGLIGESTYKIKVTATNSSGAGEAMTTLKTAGKPVVTVSSASAVTHSSATLNGSVNPDGAGVTACTFEYGTSLPSGKTAPCSPAPGKGQSAVAVSAALAALSANTKYEVKLTATNENGTREATTAFTTAEESIAPPPPSTGGGGGGGGGVLGAKSVSPTVTIAGSPASVTGSGAFTLKLTCASGATICTGTITLKTAKAVIASVGHAAKKKKKAAILTLATASFTLAGGQLKSLTLHLSSLARALLAHSHVLSALATVVAHNTASESATTKASVTLRLKVAKKR